MQAPPPPPQPVGPYGSPPRRKQSHLVLWIVGGFLICGCGGIGLIGAILFPVFQQAKLAAGKTNCMANLKRIGLANIMYANDYDERLPAGSKWIDLTTLYMPAEQGVFVCPTVRLKHGEYGYAANAQVGGKKISSFPDSSNVVLTYETAEQDRNATGDPKTDPAPNRHGKGRTESYMDGSAKWIKGSDLSSAR